MEKIKFIGWGFFGKFAFCIVASDILFWNISKVCGSLFSNRGSEKKRMLAGSCFSVICSGDNFQFIVLKFEIDKYHMRRIVGKLTKSSERFRRMLIIIPFFLISKIEVMETIFDSWYHLSWVKSIILLVNWQDQGEWAFRNSFGI